MLNLSQYLQKPKPPPPPIPKSPAAILAKQKLEEGGGGGSLIPSTTNAVVLFSPVKAVTAVTDVITKQFFGSTPGKDAAAAAILNEEEISFS